MDLEVTSRVTVISNKSYCITEWPKPEHTDLSMKTIVCKKEEVLNLLSDVNVKFSFFLSPTFQYAIYTKLSFFILLMLYIHIK